MVVVAVVVFVLGDILRGWTLCKDYPGLSRQDRCYEEKKEKGMKSKAKEKTAYILFSALRLTLYQNTLKLIAHCCPHDISPLLSAKTAFCCSTLPREPSSL